MKLHHACLSSLPYPSPAKLWLAACNMPLSKQKMPNVAASCGAASCQFEFASCSKDARELPQLALFVETQAVIMRAIFRLLA